MIGQSLVQVLPQMGYEVIPVVRPQSRIKHSGPVIHWDPLTGKANHDDFEGLDAVIHLSGAGLVSRCWSESYKKEIRESRLEPTRLLSRILLACKNPPQVVLSASGIGCYEKRMKGLAANENFEHGKGYLSRLCREWEGYLDDLGRGQRTRIIFLRFGMVLGKKGGVLKKILPFFKCWLGGTLGEGDQAISWVLLEEIPHIVQHLLGHPDISGPVNVVAPHFVSHREFVKAIGKILEKPVWLYIPEFLVRYFAGDMAEELLLKDLAVVPQKLLDSGYEFRYPQLVPSLEKALR